MSTSPKAFISSKDRSVAFYSSPLPVEGIGAASCTYRRGPARGSGWLPVAGDAREGLNQRVPDVDLISSQLPAFEQNKSSGHVGVLHGEHSGS